jgi:hypothetical protein
VTCLKANVNVIISLLLTCRWLTKELKHVDKAVNIENINVFTPTVTLYIYLFGIQTVPLDVPIKN